MSRGENDLYMIYWRCEKKKKKVSEKITGDTFGAVRTKEWPELLSEAGRQAGDVFRMASHAEVLLVPTRERRHADGTLYCCCSVFFLRF